MIEKLYYNASYIAVILGISIVKFYKILLKMNGEIDSKGIITIAWKIPADYFKGKGCRASNEASV